MPLNSAEIDEAIALVTSGVAAKAIPMLEQAAKQDPSSWQVLHALARAVDMEGDQGRAQTLLEQANTLAPSEPEPACDLAMFLLATEQDDRAQAVLEPASKAHPDHARLNLHLAMALTKASPSRARAFAGRAMEAKDPDIQAQAKALYTVLVAHSS